MNGYRGKDKTLTRRMTMTNAWHVYKWNGKDHIYCGIVRGETATSASKTMHARYGEGQYETYPHMDNATLDGGGTVLIMGIITDIANKE